MQAQERVRTNNAVNVIGISREQVVEFARGGYLYAIVDATDLRCVPPEMNSLGAERAVSLFQGTPREDQWAIAPYVVRADEAFLEWIQAELREVPWGVFAISNHPPLSVFEHLRAQLSVVLADGREWLYRFYDPKVLERHLTRGQIGTLFGTVRGYVIPYPSQVAGKAYVLNSKM